MTVREGDKEIEFPSNSRKLRVVTNAEPAETSVKRVEKVTTGQLVKKKKGFFDGAIGETAQSVGSYILWDVLIPAAKDMLLEAIKTGAEMAFYGETRGPNNIRRERGRSLVSYSSMFNKERDHNRSPLSSRNRLKHKFDDVIIDTRDEAEEVLSNLVELIENYDVATVGDFYDLVDMPSTFADAKYGWTNLNRAVVERVREGYILVMPKPYPLD